MKFQRILLWLNCLVFVIYGFAFTLFAENLAIWVTDTAPRSTSGLIDMRATYGGMSLAIGIILGILAKEATTVRLGITSLIIIMGGMATGRLLGIVIDGNANGVMYLYLAAEILVIILALVSLHTQKQA